jgi:DNA-binding XRE family transcriptional regulator
MTGDAKMLFDERRAQGRGDVVDGEFVHGATHIAKWVSKPQANSSELRQILWQNTLLGMGISDKPFADIADRLPWHRESTGLTQDDYAAKIGFKRSTYSLWEAGSHRLSLDGALALRKRWGLSMDFMYEGIADALPMTLRAAWLDRPQVSASKKSIVKPDA